MAQGVGLFDDSAEVVVDVAGLGVEGFRAVGGAITGADGLHVAQGGVMDFGDRADTGEVTEK